MRAIVWAIHNVMRVPTFQIWKTSTEHDSKSGQPFTSMSDNHIDKVGSVICANQCLIVCEMSNEVGVCENSCQVILK